MSPFFDNLRAFLQRLSVGQRLLIGSVLLGGVVALIGVAYWASRPEMGLLFGSMEPTQASQVVEALQAEGVEYELRENGTAVYVPRADVYELRLQLTSEGLVADGPKGYELFDDNTLGMTESMWELNMRRALEGELARTIASMKQVDIARVHLTLPEERAFRQSRTTPSASVVLSLAGSSRLTPAQIEGIAALVAGAVERLDLPDVTIVDDRGNLLSNPEVGNPELAAGSSQLKRQREVEEHLAAKAQSMLDEVLGKGNAIVRVAAKLDFTSVVEESDVIDPESATVISEERLEEQEGQADASANQQIRNYDISRTQSRVERNRGEVQYLTVALILNMKPPAAPPAAEGEEVAAPEPIAYTVDEVDEIEQLVQNAVAFNPERGDRITTHQTRFDTTIDDQIMQDLESQRFREDFSLYLRYGLMLIAIGLGVWLVRSVSQRATEMVEERQRRLADEPRPADERILETEDGPRRLGTGEPDEDELILVDDIYTSKLSAEAKARLKAKHQMYEELRKQILERPEESAELLKVWLSTEPVGTEPELEPELA